MTTLVNLALTNLSDKKRKIFCCKTTKNLRDDFIELQLSDVYTPELIYNEYRICYGMLNE